MRALLLQVGGTARASDNARARSASRSRSRSLHVGKAARATSPVVGATGRAATIVCSPRHAQHQARAVR